MKRSCDAAWEGEYDKIIYFYQLDIVKWPQ